MSSLIGLLAGFAFGVGLAVSEMVNPAKVLAFLDVAGRWDPSLAFVMIGALAVTFVGFRLTAQRSGPVFGERFEVPTARSIDPALLLGAAIFGIGWGLVGFCPGPAIASLAFELRRPAIFLVAMVAGAGLYHYGRSRMRRSAPEHLQRHAPEVASPEL
jgi:uncharacterized protein